MEESYRGGEPIVATVDKLKKDVAAQTVAIDQNSLADRTTSEKDRLYAKQLVARQARTSALSWLFFAVSSIASIFVVHDLIAEDAAIRTELRALTIRGTTADERGALTRDQDAQLCQRACDTLLDEQRAFHGQGAHVMDYGYLSAACTWSAGGLRTCECTCDYRHHAAQPSPGWGDAPVAEHDAPLTVEISESR